MADKFIRIGSLTDIAGYDDADPTGFTDAAEFPGPVKVLGTPTDPTHIITLADLETAIEGIMLPGPPAFPTVLSKAINNPSYPYYVPALDGDGSWLSLPTSETVGTITLYGPDGVGVGSAKAVTNFYAAADAWVGAFFLDNVARELFVIVYDTATSPDTFRLASVNLDTGVITANNTCQPGDDFHLEECHFERAAMGSGNFTLTCRGMQVVLSSANGDIVSGPSTITQSGAPITFSEYITADGLIHVKTTVSDNVHGGIIELQRGGAYGKVILPLTHALGGKIKLWEDYVAIYVIFSSSTGSAVGPRFFLRTLFDQWLHDLADYLGLP